MGLEIDSILNQIGLAAYSPQLYLCWGKDTISSRRVGCAPCKSEWFISATIIGRESNTPADRAGGNSNGLWSQLWAANKNHRMDAMTQQTSNPRVHRLHNRNAQFATLWRFKTRTAVLNCWASILKVSSMNMTNTDALWTSCLLLFFGCPFTLSLCSLAYIFIKNKDFRIGVKKGFFKLWLNTY